MRSGSRARAGMSISRLLGVLVAVALTILVATAVYWSSSALAAVLGAPTFNVMDYGATGDGATDDSAAIAAAFADASGGSVVYFPAGTYVMDKLEVNKAGITFAGAGRTVSCIKLKNQASGQMFRITESDITIRNLELDGNRANQTTKRNCIYGYPAVRLTVEDCNIHGTKGTGSTPAIQLLLGSDYAVIRRNIISNTDNCVVVQDSAYCQVLDNEGSDSATEAFACYTSSADDRSHDNYFAGNSATDCVGAAYAAENSDHNTFHNNTATNCARGLLAYGRSGAALDGNVFDNNTVVGGANTDEWGALYTGGNATGTVFSNNTVSGCTVAPAILNGAPGNTYTGNHITGSQFIVLSKTCTFSDNTVEDSIGRGIYVNAAMAGLVIDGNTIQRSGLSGIGVSFVLTDAVITDNSFLDNSVDGAGWASGIDIEKAYVNMTMTGNRALDTRTPKLQGRGLYAPNGGTGTISGNDFGGSLRDSIPPSTPTTVPPPTTPTTVPPPTTTTTVPPPTTTTTVAPPTTTTTVPPPTTTTTVAPPTTTTTTVPKTQRAVVVTIKTPVNMSVIRRGLVYMRVTTAPLAEVARVACYVDGRKLGVDGQAPFRFSWNARRAARWSIHILVVVAYDKRGIEMGRSFNVVGIK